MDGVESVWFLSLFYLQLMSLEFGRIRLPAAWSSQNVQKFIVMMMWAHTWMFPVVASSAHFYVWIETRSLVQNERASPSVSVNRGLINTSHRHSLNPLAWGQMGVLVHFVKQTVIPRFQYVWGVVHCGMPDVARKQRSLDLSVHD